jgi:hypothetical protein
MPARRFPPPWLIAELEACFVVIDGAGQKLAYVYYDDEPQRRAAAKLLTKDEARRIAANIAKLRGLNLWARFLVVTLAGWRLRPTELPAVPGPGPSPQAPQPRWRRGHTMDRSIAKQ